MVTSPFLSSSLSLRWVLIASMETGGIRRRHLLHACGVSALTIAHNACKRAEEVQGPIGSLSHRIASLAGPIVGPMESQWLAFLSFADDRILAAENMVETLFPSSAYVFDKIDSFVDLPEALPGKFDRVVDILPVIVRRVPFLQWSATLFIWELNLLLSLFTDGRSDDAAKEKEIMVDDGCNELAFANGTPPEQMMDQPDPMKTTNHAHNNEDHYVRISPSIHNSPASPPIGDRENKALFFEEDSISADKCPNRPPSASPPPSDHENEATYKEVLIGKSPLAPVGEPQNAAKEKEIMIDNNEGHLAPKSHPIHNSPYICPQIGDSENEALFFEEASVDKSPPLASPRVDECENGAVFKKALMGKSPPPPTGQTKAERKATACESEKTSVLNGETVKQVKGTSYKDVLEMGNRADKEMKEESVGKEELQKPAMDNVRVGEKEKPTEAAIGTKGPNELKSKEFPILELFDAGWHMKA